jgi:4-amino-4-deoxy-L-arabinose transferase-like glycosyltransferase
MTPIAHRRWLPWLGLLCVLAVYVFSVVRLHPTNFFGLTQDDTVYFSSAKALADGQGYILPSVPETPRATKYPFLYPWILSWVWRFGPSFPDNVAGAVGVTVVFGCIFLSAAFLFLRQLSAFSNLEALLLTLCCALHPIFRVYSANILSDIPFAAFALAAIVISNFALRRNPGMALAAVCGIVAGLSIFVRVLGVPIAAGVLVTMLWGREWRKATVFSASVAPFFVALAWRALSAPYQAPAAVATCATAWQGTWLSYTSYVGMWKIIGLHKGILWPIFKQNALLIVLQPGIYFADPRFIRPSDLGTVFTCLLSAVVLFGMFHLARKTGWQPIHFSLAFYIVPLLFWPYPIAERCLLPFLPLFVTGIWGEGKRLSIRIRESFNNSPPRTERWAAALLSVVIVVSAVGIGLAQERNSDLISRESRERGTLLPEKHEAYSWLSANTPPGSKAIAYEDISLFLFSGRQALRPITFSSAALYDPSLLQSDVDCLMSSAQGIHASYWVMSDDDFSIEWTDATSAGVARETQLSNLLPELFRSSSGRVRIYGLNARSGESSLTQ